MRGLMYFNINLKFNIGSISGSSLKAYSKFVNHLYSIINNTVYTINGICSNNILCDLIVGSLATAHD